MAGDNEAPMLAPASCRGFLCDHAASQSKLTAAAFVAIDRRIEADRNVLRRLAKLAEQRGKKKPDEES
jgi:hypothetical protein